MDRSFWQNKRVLVTGHTGFKGAWLVFWLKRWGAKVSGLALAPNTTPNAFSALSLEKHVDQHLEIDIRDGAKLAAAVQKINPEIVFHLAAQPLVRLSYAEPMETYATNVLGTGHVLLSLRGCPAVRSVVVVTTDKCYENREWHWGYRETDTLGGHDPYSSSKACTEILTASFRRSYFQNGQVGIATARAGNVIGGGDWSQDRLVPDLIQSIRTGQKMEIRSPHSIRPWQHVLSPLSGYITLAQKLFTEPAKWSTAFNFAPDDADCVPVEKLIQAFGQAWGAEMPYFLSQGDHPHEAHFLKLDSSKARADLGWHPPWNLSAALKATADWYRTFYETPEGIEELTAQQIESFLSRKGADA